MLLIKTLGGTRTISLSPRQHENTHTSIMKLPHNTIEITSEAAELLIGNPESSWLDFGHNEQCEMTTYFAHGLRIFAISNYTSPTITQYYVQDINA